MSRWVWIGGIGLGLGALGVVLLLWNASDRAPTVESAPLANASSPEISALLASTATLDTAHQESPALPMLDFPPGSVEEACRLNDFPPSIGYYFNSQKRSELIDPRSGMPYTQNSFTALESEACRAALEAHLSAINPFLWGVTYENSTKLGEQLMALFVLDEPLTFGRIFADPAGDFHRVQEALSRPECLLEPGKQNWELQDACHADAFLNYALINRFCFDSGVRNRARTYYWVHDNPTLEHDRLMWKEDLEDYWVKEKCEGLESILEFTLEQHPELYNSVMSLSDPALKDEMSAQELLIELAARLGDDAAGLPQNFRNLFRSYAYTKDGYKFGRITKLLGNDWRDYMWKKKPSVNRFLRTFHFLARIESPKPDHRDTFELNWEWVARHLCEPPYYTISIAGRKVPMENVEHPSCKEIVHEIRQSGTTFRPLLDVVDKFEQVALELEVYE